MTTVKYKVRIADVNETEEVESLEAALDFVRDYIIACYDTDDDDSGITVKPGAFTIQRC